VQRKIFLVTLVIIVIVSLALLYFLLQSKAPSPTQPAQPIVNASRPQQAQNATQAQPQPRQPTIIATIETSGGGSVLANGTYIYTWSSSSSFTLLLKAVPDTCHGFDHWEVNGTEHSGTDLALAITGNTTIRAVFYKPLYTVTINTNATGAAAQINGENHTLPTSLRVPACLTLEVKPLETPLYKPLNNTLKITVSSDTNIMLYYRQKSTNSIQILINGKPQEVEVRQSPFIERNGTIETTSDGLIHINGSMYIFIYVPWNYTHVTVQADIKPLSDFNGFEVARYCDWGTVPFAYYKSFYDVSRVEFLGCMPVGVSHYGYISGKRYDFEKPGAISIDAINVEAWVKIEAYP
jgi:hypothetical protein